MQTILGAGGAIGRNLAKELIHYTDHIRLVGRNPTKINNSDELFPADLTKNTEVIKAVQGSQIVYLVAGIPYNIKSWLASWPLIMKNVIEACITHQAKLVFFDNVYMYDPKTVNNLREENLIAPTSKKGKVRAQIAQMILDEIKTRKLSAMIVRAADFYGPGIFTSMIVKTVFKKFKKGKKANWIGRQEKIHSATFTPDAAKATALLGNTPDAYGQVWHLPTDPQPITGLEWMQLFAQEMKVGFKFTPIPTFVIRVLGLFNSFMRELPEMMYQYENDYFFNSTKFMNRFPSFRVTSYREGVKEIVRHHDQNS
ncbi:MAG: SDR family oxidoreductase [Flavisolibacter sp.]